MTTTVVFHAMVCKVVGGAGGGVSEIWGAAGDRPDQSAELRRSFE